MTWSAGKRLLDSGLSQSVFALTLFLSVVARGQGCPHAVCSGLLKHDSKAHKWDLGFSHRVTLDVVIMKECERAEVSGLSTLGRDPVLALPLLSVFNTFSLFVIHSCRTRKHTPTPERGQI
ncbi:hypothetical protein DPX16_16601 [Anabarilius grahami]|uniref:Uncharacterized protein n=1 Tax=Anabarilius grahami TaxID=495550 RepID=A0A3N0XVS4_ANAGA|nr:hypothetical protein DPX16_16601 [Anabarilius grahami]